MNQTTIAKAHKIAIELYSDLLKTGAIDAKHNVIKTQMFIDIIEHAESELNKLMPEVENEAGVTIDRNGANVIYNYISIFNEMKETMAVNPETLRAMPDEEKQITPEQPKKPGSYKSGIKKIFGKIKSKFTPTTEKTETR